MSAPEVTVTPDTGVQVETPSSTHGIHTFGELPSKVKPAGHSVASLVSITTFGSSHLQPVNANYSGHSRHKLAFKYHPGQHEAHVVAEAEVLHSFGPTSQVSAASLFALKN
jgi:hypothetical protein